MKQPKHNRHLSKGQQRRIQASQDRRLAKRQSNTQTNQPGWQDEQLGPLQTGRIVSRFGQHADLLSEQNKLFRCHIRRTIQSLVTGDKVAWRPASEQEQGMQGVIEAVEPRHSELLRPDIYDGLKPIAANVDQIFIVSSIQPAFSDQMIDRYLVACENSQIEPVIIINKVDLLTSEQSEHIQKRLEVYRAMGYLVLEASAQTGQGIDAIRAQALNQVSVFVGQSGVGKSSLIQQAMPELDLAIGDISKTSGLGQHTTTVARWYPLPQGGALIDSPGVREFGLWHLDEIQVAQGFIDFKPFIGQCKFRDCKHQTDPGCALQAAVADGQLDATRLANYHRIIRSISQLTNPSTPNI